ncbi:hypothetical protein D3C72_1951630 [compost metagenome]
MHDEDQPLLIGGQKRALFAAEATQVIGAAALEKMQITGVVNEAGEIRILIIDPLRQAVAMFDQFTRKRNHKLAHTISLRISAASERPSRMIRCSCR